MHGKYFHIITLYVGGRALPGPRLELNLEPAEHSARHTLLHIASKWSSHRTMRADDIVPYSCHHSSNALPLSSLCWVMTIVRHHLFIDAQVFTEYTELLKMSIHSCHVWPNFVQLVSWVGTVASLSARWTYLFISWTYFEPCVMRQKGHEHHHLYSSAVFHESVNDNHSTEEFQQRCHDDRHRCQNSCYSFAEHSEHSCTIMVLSSAS